ncbi:uncharacterized protein METZ01_LOCUS205847, partial [marine metagenome]
RPLHSGLVVINSDHKSKQGHNSG